MNSGGDMKGIGKNPFPGLRPFTPEENDLFFGREAESRDIAGKLLERKFVAVTGESGTGKSSIIFSGVIPLIESQEPGNWRVLSFRPGKDLPANFGKELVRAGLLSGYGDVVIREFFGDTGTGPDEMPGGRAESGDGAGNKIVIVIDQFEELFRYGLSGPTTRERALTSAFIRLIVNSALNRNNNAYFIISMRSDFVGECTHYHGLAELINESSFLVPQMSHDNYRRVITGPVEQYGAAIEEELVNELLAGIEGRSDRLPVLQHALMRTWHYWQQSGDTGRPVSVADYQAAGGLEDAMSRHADEAYEELTAEQRSICEAMFKAITDKGSDNRGVRRPVEAAAICEVAGCSVEELSEVVSLFSKPSRSFLAPESREIAADTVIDIAHESLMRLWDRLQGWVDEEAESAAIYRRLSEASAMHQQGRAGLLQQPDLQIALAWRDKTRPTVKWAERYDPAFERAMVYLSASEREYAADEERRRARSRRRLWRVRATALILGVAAIISLAFLFVEYQRSIDSERERLEALAARQEADKRRSEAEQEAIRAMEMESASRAERERVEAEAEEARREEREAMRQRAVALINAEAALRERALEEERRAEAERRAGFAEAVRDSAVAAGQIAQEDRERVEALRMLAVSRAMSVKSLQIEGRDDGLRGVLAYQAYLFNRRHGGRPNDVDIYTGLYGAVRETGADGYREFHGHSGGDVRSIAFDNEGKAFYTSDQKGRIVRWFFDGDPDNYEVVWSGESSVGVLAVSPDSRWLASGDDEAAIRLIPLMEDDEVVELKGHTGAVRSLVFSFDGTTLYSASFDGDLLEWDLVAHTSESLNDNIGVRISDIEISAGGNFIAGIDQEGDVLVWDSRQRGETFRIDVEGSVNTLRFDPLSNTLALGTEDGWLELWDIESRTKKGGVKAHGDMVTDIAFNALYDQVATSGYDRTIAVFDMDGIDGLPLLFTDNDSIVITIRFTPDGGALVSGAAGGLIAARKSHADYLAESLYPLIERNMTPVEWRNYVGRDIDYEATKHGIGYDIVIERR